MGAVHAHVSDMGDDGSTTSAATSTWPQQQHHALGRRQQQRLAGLVGLAADGDVPWASCDVVVVRCARFSGASCDVVLVRGQL